VKTADMVWVATALLHRGDPDRAVFAPKEIRARAVEEGFAPALPPGFDTHVSQQTVANRPPNPGKYRLLYAEGHGMLRLFRSDDDASPGRTGKRLPAKRDLPERYWPLLDWYWSEFDRRPAPTRVLRESRNLVADPTGVGLPDAEIARRALARIFEQPFSARPIGDIPRRFDFVSSDQSVVGGFEPLRNLASAQSRLLAISQAVWLLEKAPAQERVLVFGHDRDGPIDWLARFGHLATGLRFFVLTDRGELEELSQDRAQDAAWARLAARSFARDWNSEEDSVYDEIPTR
jgi:hypothetical protein